MLLLGESVTVETEYSFIDLYVIPAGPVGILISLIGLSLMVLTPIGVWRARRANAWPHWRRLVRGFGEAAFRLGVLGFAAGMITAYLTISEMGASATPLHFWKGFVQALTPVFLGALVGLIGMLGSGIIRVLSPADSPS